MNEQEGMAALRSKTGTAAPSRSVVLPSGLRVLCRMMPDYSTVHAMYATAFGSVMRSFSLDGKKYNVPAGTAHFLEHKMFESEQGDAFELYAKTGASANAFTAYDKTCYIFSATSQFDKNLDILLNMVGTPYFTEKTIAKEQGIIGQEIKMYEDSTDWRLLNGLMRCLYRNHPIREDICGTVDSIAALTPELLYACTNAFYAPQNMVLSVAGNIEPERVLEACARAGLDRPVPKHQVQLHFAAEPAEIPQREMRFHMPVTKPCFALGYREKPIARGDTKTEILCDMLPDLICGGLTELYRKLYDDGLVNPEFGGDYVSANECCCIAFTGESTQPAKVAGLVQKQIEFLRKNGVNRKLFTLVKNQMYGEMLADLENVEDAADEMAGACLHGRTLADEIETLAALKPEDADAALGVMLREPESAYVEIQPQNDEP